MHRAGTFAGARSGRKNSKRTEARHAQAAAADEPVHDVRVVTALGDDHRRTFCGHRPVAADKRMRLVPRHDAFARLDRGDFAQNPRLDDLFHLAVKRGETQHETDHHAAVGLRGPVVRSPTPARRASRSVSPAARGSRLGVRPGSADSDRCPAWRRASRPRSGPPPAARRRRQIRGNPRVPRCGALSSTRSATGSAPATI